MSDHSDNEDHFHDADASTPALEAAGVPAVFDAVPNLSANGTSIDASAMVAEHQDRFLTPEVRGPLWRWTAPVAACGRRGAGILAFCRVLTIITTIIKLTMF